MLTINLAKHLGLSVYRVAQLLSDMTFEDAVTGVYGPRYLRRFLEEQVATDEPFVLTLFDLDHFATINEARGPLEGDLVLKSFATRLKALLHGNDVVARYREDAFAVVTFGRPIDEVHKLVDRFRQRTADKPVKVRRGGDLIYLAMSASMVSFPDDAATIDGVFEAAETTLFAAKKLGGNRVLVVSEADPVARGESAAISGVPCGKLIGRRDELTTAELFVEEVRDRKPGILLISGDRGIGKTRLLKDLVGKIGRRGVVYLASIGRGSKGRMSRALPYLVQRYYERHPATRDWLRRALSPLQRKGLSELVPLFSGWRALKVDPGADMQKASREALEGALVGMAREAPLLLLLDNISEIDPMSLEALRPILCENKAPLGLIATMSGELGMGGAQSALVSLLADLRKRRRLKSVYLPQIVALDMGVMIGEILPGFSKPSWFDETLKRTCAGNPRKLEESIRFLVEKGKVSRVGMRWKLQIETPEEMQGLLQEALKREPRPEQTQLLTNVAILGTGMDLVYARVDWKAGTEKPATVPAAKSLLALPVRPKPAPAPVAAPVVPAPPPAPPKPEPAVIAEIKPAPVEAPPVAETAPAVVVEAPAPASVEAPAPPAEIETPAAVTEEQAPLPPELEKDPLAEIESLPPEGAAEATPAEGEAPLPEDLLKDPLAEIESLPPVEGEAPADLVPAEVEAPAPAEAEAAPVEAEAPAPSGVEGTAPAEFEAAPMATETPVEAEASAPVDVEAPAPVAETEAAPAEFEAAPMETEAPVEEAAPAMEAELPAPAEGKAAPAEAETEAPAEAEQVSAEAEAPAPAEEEAAPAEAEVPAEAEQLQAEAEAPAEAELQAEAEAPAEAEQLQAEAEVPAEAEQLQAEAEAPAEAEQLQAEAPAEEAPAPSDVEGPAETDMSIPPEVELVPASADTATDEVSGEASPSAEATGDEAAGEPTEAEAQAPVEEPVPSEVEAAQPEAEQTGDEILDLQSEGLQGVRFFMETLCAGVRRGRLYPQWMNRDSQPLPAIRDGALALVELVPLVTFSIESGALQINGRAVDMGPGTEFIGEFMKLLDGRLISRLSIVAGVDAREMDAFVAEMCSPVDRAVMREDHWATFRERDKVTHLDVLQRPFSPETDAAGIAIKDTVRGEQPPTEQQMAQGLQALRGMGMASRLLRANPPEEAGIEEALQGACVSLQGLLDELLVVSFDFKEGAFTMNGQPMPTDMDAMFLGAALAEKKLQTLTMRTGISDDEVRAAASALSMAADVPEGSAYLRTILSPGLVRNFYLARPSAPPIETLVGTILKMPTEGFILVPARVDFATLLQAASAKEGLAESVIARMNEAMASERPEIRRKALEIERDVLRKLKGPMLSLFIEVSHDAIVDRILQETDPIAQTTLATVARLWITGAILANRMPLAANMCTKAIKPAIDAGPLAPEARQAFVSGMQSVGQGAGGALMEMLSVGSDDERMNAAAVVAVVGAGQISQFVKLVLESDKLEVRQAAARAVAAIGGEAPNELVATIRAQADPEKAKRVVGVLDLLGLPRLVAPIQAALAHPDPTVKSAAFEMLERAADPVAEDVLRFLIRGEDEEVALRGLEIAAKRRHAALATDIARLGQTTEREALGAGCCAFFQAVPTPAGVPALQRIFDMRGKMMGLVKGWSDKTRAAAVSAAVLVNTPAAKSIVKAALKDQSPVVREAAGAEARAK